ncbi:LPP20 family lipoprotein [Bacterioplanes sanyensis]|uniref:LPP20 family lipoprotein n=1 Tax=Bacterioplanes sanyensis TaxID=1249553 RepID=UPI0012FDF8B1|nr:LPP20 family lipoprotein [Bacterioplanes sanyensis]
MASNKALLLALTGSLWLAGCSSQPTSEGGRSDVPMWVEQVPQRSGFAYGVGSMEVYGDPVQAQQRAADLARADLVSQLKVTISGDFENQVTERSGTGRETEIERVVRQQVRSQIKPVELDEVHISEQYSGQYNGRQYAYALAELDRSAAAARLRQRMADVEQQLQPLVASAPTGSRMQQLQRLLPAMPLFEQRQQLAEQLAFVSTSRRSEPLPTDLQHLQERIQTLIGQLQVAVVARDRDAEKLETAVIQALTQQGLRVQSQGADLTFELEADISGRYKNQSHYVFADCQVRIVDGNGRVLSVFSERAKGVSGVYDMARQSAAQRLADAMSDAFAASLISLLD